MLPWYSAIEFYYRTAMTFWILSWEYSLEGLRTSTCLALARTWKHVCEGEISHSPHLDLNSLVKSPKMGFKLPFCRCQFVHKCWVQVQGKTLQSGLILCFCRRRNFSLVSASEETFLQFLPQDWLFCYAIKLLVVQ